MRIKSLLAVFYIKGRKNEMEIRSCFSIFCLNRSALTVRERPGKFVWDRREVRPAVLLGAVPGQEKTDGDRPEPAGEKVLLDEPEKTGYNKTRCCSRARPYVLPLGACAGQRMEQQKIKYFVLE